MIAKLRHFIATLTSATSTEQDQVSLQLACAVLLTEIMRADGNSDDDERAAIIAQLAQHFALSKVELTEILTSAELLSEQATDFYQFTSKINKNYTINDKIKLLDMLWQVANADGEISAIEQHTIRKIADLLHLRHNEYVRSKLKITP
ncbi:MAG: hypothetical protein COB35_06670 [Gammaproteobacteria bacterium]|nr:MAG: hypothetical protein COB35_06670 [Gammaproteobacteria bacterium]